MDMRGYVHADIPCPSCGKTPNAIVYMRASTVTLFCQECYQAWSLERGSHPGLANLPDPMDGHNRMKF